MSKELSEEYKQFIQESGGVVELAKLPIWQFGELAIQFGRALGRRGMKGEVKRLAEEADQAHREYDESWHMLMDAIEAIPEEV